MGLTPRRFDPRRLLIVSMTVGVLTVAGFVAAALLTDSSTVAEKANKACLLHHGVRQITDDSFVCIDGKAFDQ